MLIAGYERAAITLNYIRALIKGGFADLHHPEYWDLDWAQLSPHGGRVPPPRRQPSRTRSASWSTSWASRAGETDRIDFYTSHEALHLGYEQAQTRRVPRRTGWFNLSTHFPWIGIRTSSPGGAHVEYMRGIENPIAVKVGMATDPTICWRLCDILDPHNQPGRLTLIHRFGVETVADGLPRCCETVRARGQDRAVGLRPDARQHARHRQRGIRRAPSTTSNPSRARPSTSTETCGSRLGGVHIELTGENVTECTGGARGLSEADLSQAYETELDPRLNYEQSLEIAMLVATKLASIRQEG